MNLKALLGVAGVHRKESPRARSVGRTFEYLVAIAVLLVFLQLVLSYTHFPIEYAWLDRVLWGVFVAELVVNLILVQDRSRYLLHNWLSVLIVLVAAPWISWQGDWALIFRALRLVLFLRFVSTFFQDVLLLLKRNRFGQILSGFAFLVIGSGGIFSYIEQRPIIDGIWYALVTITTVGYGDVVPLTQEGRIFGSVLIVFGVMFFSLVTANFSAFLIGSDQRKLEREILNYVRQTEKRLATQSLQNEKHVESIMLHSTQQIDRLKEELHRYRALEEYLLDMQQKADPVPEEFTTLKESSDQPSISNEGRANPYSHVGPSPFSSPHLSALQDIEHELLSVKRKLR
ncbi:hypothetical protein THMIRHAS_10510 [Thiosulfatimonas sediminis]|uniref:Potassium channel domain-containing protein n=1 Tax=Thiosulfatimonas sediminis TaxID=2675054 RepID=A0A6F8PUJ5_9GAMM|nr:potassium channel family protein [Thiosulfatimonas sediminis]BBP45678.1 hypothetical protein THMIRHAS_10510 [Thiosulfatimonas sediminis]